MSALEPSVLLASLQHGDSFFPSGSIAFSWGLETLRADGLVRSAGDVQRFIEGQLKHRWNSCDRPALMAAFAARDALEPIAQIDFELEALSLAKELREGSRRAGGTLLRVHEQLDTPVAKAYREWVRAGKALGHLAPVQGLVWGGIGLPSDAACALSAHTLCVGVLGAALRLGMVGHVDAQKILQHTRSLIAQLMESPANSEWYAFVPAAEIAMMRHETQDSRLFAS